MILTLQDDSFFDLMQIWFGEIQSPFNKQELVVRLENFLSKPKTQNRIIEILDAQDKAILSAIELAPNKTVDSLYRYFKKEISFSTYSLKLINMEQRLLIYRKASPNGNPHEETLHINPLLHTALSKEVLDIYNLILPLDQKSDSEKSPWLNDALLLAFYSYIEENHPILKMDGSWKKKEKEKLGELIPVLKNSITGIDRFEWIKAVLFKLNLIENNDSRLYNIHENWKILGSDRPNETLFKIMLSAIITGESCLLQKEPPKEEENNLSEEILFESKQPNPLNSHEINSIGNALAKLCCCLSKETVYDKIQFEKLLLLFELENYFLSGLELLLFIEVEDEKLQINPIFEWNKIIAAPKNQAIIESNFDAIIKPWSQWGKALTLASISNLTYCDRYPHYQINRSSFCRALDSGYSASQIIEDLQTLTGSVLAQNIRQSLIDWEKKFRKIRLIQGTLLVVTPDEIPFLIKSGILRPYIVETLCEGIYILDESQRAEWEKALNSGGIEEIPTPQKLGEKREPVKTEMLTELKDFIQKRLPENSLTWDAKNEKEHSPSRAKIHKREKEGIHPQEKEIIAKIESLNLPPEIKEEYYARLKKRLILTPESVTKPSNKFEKREARGLDFRGKLAIIEHALISQKELLEITLLTSKTTNAPFLIFPKKLTKVKDQQILQGIALDSERFVEIKLDQIKSVRRLLSALFFPEN